jgi:hypothetical protein
MEWGTRLLEQAYDLSAGKQHTLRIEAREDASGKRDVYEAGTHAPLLPRARQLGELVDAETPAVQRLPRLSQLLARCGGC